MAAALTGGDVNTGTATAGNAAENNVCGTGACIAAAMVFIAAYTTYTGDGDPIAGLQAIGRGDDPLSRAIESGVAQAVELSSEIYPEETAAVLNALGALGAVSEVVVTYVDQATGEVVSRAWNQIPEHVQDGLRGGAIVATLLIPAGTVERISARLPEVRGTTRPDPDNRLNPGTVRADGNGLDVTAGGRPIEFDGQYYSADGFKFSDRYYRYLYDNGRPAPFFQAREVLNSNPRITPDPQGTRGFFRYEGGGLEMIYNPTTGQVIHLQPIR